MTAKVMNFANRCLDYFKYSYSIVLLLFSVSMVMSCIFQNQSTATFDMGLHPILACIIFWILIGWLGIMEGGQGCIVGLKPVSPTKYATTHPLTLKTCQVAHHGDNLERFIIGRQFLVVLVIFLINMMGNAIPHATPFPNLPPVFNTIFLENGVAMMLTTINIGQLPSQVNAAVAMLDFINNYIMIVTTYISLIIEFSGLLHCVHLVQFLFAIVTKTKIQSNEDERTMIRKVFFWLRVLMSVTILGFALAVTIEALKEGKSGMWESVSPTLSIILFLVLLCVVGLMEGIQIAAFALINTSEEELIETSTMAYSNCQLMFDNGNNFQSFLIGRQIFVAALMFIVARIATINVEVGQGLNIFGVSDSVQSFLNTGLLGSIILTVIGSLAWRVIASSYPLLFMSNPLIYIIIRACFLLEATGICAASWLIAVVMRIVFRLKNDNVYLGDGDDMATAAAAAAAEEMTEIAPATVDTGFTDETSKRKTPKRLRTGAGARRASYAMKRLGSSIRSSIISRRGSVVSLASEELRIRDEEDDMVTQMEKMRNSFVASARLSAVLNSEDLDALMSLDNIEDVVEEEEDNDGDSYRRYDDEDVIDEESPQQLQQNTTTTAPASAPARTQDGGETFDDERPYERM